MNPENCYTSLHHACNLGRLETATLLVELGSNVNALTDNDRTPIMAATMSDATEIVSLLLDHGADATIADEYWRTPLHLASQFGALDIMR